MSALIGSGSVRSSSLPPGTQGSLEQPSGWIRRSVGPLLLSLSLLIFGAAVLRVDLARGDYFNLYPWPDAPEYVDSARSFVETGRFDIRLGEKNFPPRYPFGYPLALTGALSMGISPEAAPYRVNQLAGLTLIILVYWISRRTWSGLEAGLAALLLTSLPGFLTLCRSPMSEIVSVFVVMVSVVLLAEYLRSHRVSYGIMASVVLATAVAVRTSNLFLLALPVLAALWTGRDHIHKLKQALLMVIALGVGMTPLLVSNWIVFGSPWMSGYSLWVPHWADPSHAFSWYYVPYQLETLGREFLQLESGNGVAFLFGNGSYVGPAFLVLMGWAAFRAARQPVLQPFLLGAVVYGLAMCSYFFQDVRLFLPIFVMACPAMAWTMSSALQPSQKERLSSRRLAAMCLLGAVILGVPGQGLKPELMIQIRRAGARRPAREYDLVKAFQQLSPGSQHRVVFTDLAPPYVHALTDGARSVYPVNDQTDYSYAPTYYKFDDWDRQRLLRSSLQAGSAVYLISGRNPSIEPEQLLPPPKGYRWSILFRNDENWTVSQLYPG